MGLCNFGGDDCDPGSDEQELKEWLEYCRLDHDEKFEHDGFGLLFGSRRVADISKKLS